jgi:hypothetical protein
MGYSPFSILIPFVSDRSFYELLWLETTKKGKRQQVSVELEASLAPAEAEVGAVAKADQKKKKREEKR